MRLTFSTVFLLCAQLLLSQINSLPHTQSFEQSFTTGTNVTFIANWQGNEVASSNRIFRGTDARTGTGSLNVIPTSTFNGEVLISLDLNAYLGAKISFFAFSKENGATSTRPAILRFSTSIDGGNNYLDDVQIGNDNTFPNNNSTTYTQYEYSLPAQAGNQSNVIVKIDVSRGSGSGSVAELVMDDFLIEEELPPLSIQNLSANSATELEITFNQNVQTTSAQTASNYTLNYGFGSPNNAVINGSNASKVTLTLAKAMVNNTYEITVNGVVNSDASSTASDLKASVDFDIQTPKRSLVINEIFADPTGANQPSPTVLPTGTSQEFIEVYNTSNESVDISNFTLSGGTIGNHVIAPNDYVILTSASNVAAYQGFGNTIAVSSWNTLTNGGEQIILNDQLGNLVDSVTFSMDWYNDTDKADGGWTLEQVNPELTCSGANNWSASNSAQGGTPASVNSIYNNSPDITGATLDTVIISSPTQLLLVFSEIMDQASLEAATYGLSGGINVNNASANTPGLTSVNLNLASAMISGTVYTLAVNNAQDCSGNVNTQTSIDFVFDNEAPVLERFEFKTSQLVHLHFNENLNTINAETESNYSINNSIGAPSNATINATNNTVVSLSLASALTDKENYQLTLNGITDTLGNSLSNDVNAFTFENHIDTVIVISSQLLDVYFEQAINASAAITTNYEVSNSIGNPVSAIIDSGNDKLVHLTFGGSFPENSQVEISFSNIQNAANAFLQTLNTPFVYDTDDPDLLSHEVVDANTLVLNFDEILNQTSAEAVNNYTVNNGIGIPASAQLFNAHTSVRLTFNTAFEQETENRLTYTAIEDLSSNAISTNRNEDFTYDTRPPRFTELLVYSPVELLLVFSEEVVESIAENTSNFSVNNGIGNPILATRLDSATNKILLTFTDLGNNATNVLTISNQTDLFTNDLNTDIDVEFSSLLPAVGNLKVLSDTLLRIQFTKELTQASAENVENYGFDNGIGSFSITQDINDASRVFINLTTSLVKDVNYRMVVDSLQDTFGNYIPTTTYDFTFDNQIEGISILSSNSLLIDFDLILEESSAETVNNYLIDQNIGNPVSAVLNPADKSQVTLSLASNLEESQSYKIAISGVNDQFGEPLTASNTSFVYDVTPPTIQQINSVYDNEIEVVFNEPLDGTTAKTLNHYSINNGIGQPTSIKFSNTQNNAVLLEFATVLMDGLNYTLTVDRIEDTQGKAMTLTNTNFTFNALITPSFRNIVINEVYFDVDPNGGLPTFEYIELFNNNANDYQLREFKITDKRDTAILKTQMLNSSGFIVLSSGSGAAALGGMALTNFPSLSNNGETILLLDRNDNIIDSLAYDVSFYNDPAKSEGGFSIELINPNKSCFDVTNFGASTNPNGGTPGTTNSIFDNSADVTAPILNSLNIISTTVLELNFNEAMDISSLVAGNFNVQAGIAISNVELQNTFGTSIQLTLASAFDRGTTQTLNYSVQDCAGNTLNGSTPFELGALPSINQLLITEIMATPTPSQGLPTFEYIEIYNNSSDIIALNEVYLRDNAGRVRIGDYNINPNEYLILSSNNGVTSLSVYGTTIGINSFPTFTLQDEARLENADSTLIFEVSYGKSFFNDEMKEDGGYSLEMIRLNPACQSPDNWTGSSNAQGGTPGSQNSVFTNSVDSTPPTVESFTVLSDTTFRLQFSESMDLSSLIATNFSFSSGIVIENISIQDDFGYQVLVEITAPYQAGILHSLALNNIEDCAGNTLSNNSFEFAKGRMPLAYELIITEVMAKPTPSVGLPEVEYVEILNTSSDIISLENVVLADLVGSSRLDEHILSPGEYMVLTPNSGADQIPGSMGLFNWPNLNDDSETLKLFNSNNDEIFRLSYDNTWYRSSIKSAGGYSIEMIDLNYPCVEASNWTASTDNDGGTPGSLNSVNGSNPDLTGPQLVGSYQLDQGSISLQFSERLNVGALVLNDFSIDNGVNFISFIVAEDQKSITLYTDVDLVANTIYTITVSSISDCTGNLIDQNANSSVLIVPDIANEGDIIVNEVLFNPRTGGARFVELYNNSLKHINLKDWRISGLNNNRILFEEDFFLAPSQFLGVTNDLNNIQTEYPGTRTESFIEITSMPSMRDDNGAAIVLNNNGLEIDRFDYNEDFHSPLIADVEGVSLERIRYSGPSNDENNWFSASSNSNYATPGYANSQALSNEARRDILDIEPESFSPDLPGIANFTSLNYAFDEPGNVISITIYDANGRIVRRVTENKLVGTRPFFTWDGTKESGGKARIGYYMVLTEIISSSGRVSYLKDKVAIGSSF